MSRLRPQGGSRSGAEIAASWLILAVSAVISVGPLVTPAPQPEPLAGEFSVDRALDHVANIAQEPRPMGSAANAGVRDYLISELTALGLRPELQTVEVPDYFGEPGTTVELVNVMARIPGEDPTRAIALMAHYDSVPTTPGANDNAAAVAAVLETGRVLRAGPVLRNDVILLFTDGEEPAPRFGSAAFVREHPWFDDVGFVVNLEAAAGSGPSTLIETSGPGAWVINGFAGAAPHPVAFSFLTSTVEQLGEIGTDFDSFSAVGIDGLNFSYLRNSPIYHTAMDSVGAVDAGSIGHHGSNALGVVRHFGDTDLSQPPEPGEAIYFTVARSTLVRYSTAWALPLALLAAALFGVGVAMRARRGDVSLRAVLVGAGVALAGMVVVIVVATFLWRIIAGVRSTQGVGESYGYLVGLVVLVGGIWALTTWFAHRGLAAVDVAGGVILIWLVFALITGAAMPGASYLFVWPALGASAVVLIRAGSGHAQRWLSPVGLLAVAAPTLVVMVPPVDTFFQMAQPRPGNPGSEMVEAVAVAMFLAFLSVALIASAASYDRDAHGSPV